MGKKIRLTTAQALIKFLNQQYIHVDGEETPFVEGIFTIFGHGNVVGITSSGRKRTKRRS
ncbi:hypothetical protein DT075_04330 [Bacillus licheniformis]|nr:hypothetical protein DT075_04330 [Bacillus licheniformis]